MATAAHSEASELGNELAGLHLALQSDGGGGNEAAGSAATAAVKSEAAEDDSITGAAKSVQHIERWYRTARRWQCTIVSKH